MKRRLGLFLRSRYPWALGAGLALAAGFPKLNIAGLAWIAPGLILLASMGKLPKQVFRLGFAAGLAANLAALYWLLLIPVPWAWKWAPALGWFALAAFLAFFTGTWAWLCWRFYPRAKNFWSARWGQRLLWTLAGAAAWVALEMVVARIFGGFPWNLLGTSQYRILPLIQIASFTGIYGVSFLVVWMSLSLLGAGMAIVRRPAMRSAWVAEIILPMTVVAVVFATGYHKLLQPAARHPMLKVALIQPSIPQNLIWDPAGDTERFQQLLALSEAAATNHPDVLIWPEAAVPRMIRYHQDTFYAVSGFAEKHQLWMIIGSDDAEPHPGATSPTDNDYFNASFLVSPEGKLVERYQKRNLVIFGEYVPLIHVLPFLKYLTPIEGGFTPGTAVTPFKLAGLNVQASVLICFEDVFPHLVREYVFDDTDFLVNLTNNGWFGESAAQWQHAAGAVFRAVENGVPLVRCSNNGLTCWVDATGRLREIFHADSHGVYGAGFMTADVPVLNPGEKRAATFYRAHGDRFGWACVAVTALLLARTFLPRKQPH